MTNRLTAKEAAEITERKQLLNSERQKILLNANRLFNIQCEKMLEAAILGKKEVEFHKKLVRGAELINLGFRIINVNKIKKRIKPKRWKD